MSLTIVAKEMTSHFNTISGVTEAVNTYYFLHAWVCRSAKFLELRRTEAFFWAWEFKAVPVFNAFCVSYRVFVWVFNIHRPSTPKGKGNLVEKCGIELFPIFKKILPVPFCNIVPDALMGLAFLANGLANIRGGHSVSDQKKRQLETLEEEILQLEVRTEYCQELQKIQQVLGDRPQIQRILDSYDELQEIITQEGRLDAEIDELEKLKELIESTEHVKRDKLYGLESQKTFLASQRGGGQDQAKVEAQIKEIKLIQSTDPKVCDEAIKELEETVQKKTVEHNHKLDHRQVVTAREKEDLNETKRALKRARFIGKRFNIGERINYLIKLRDYPRKIDLKNEQLAEIIGFVQRHVILIPDFGLQNMHLRAELRKKIQLFLNLDATKKTEEFTKFKMKKEIAQRLRWLRIFKFIEEINSTLIYSTQLVKQLKDKKAVVAAEIEGEIESMKERLDQMGNYTCSLAHEKLKESLVNKRLGLAELEEQEKAEESPNPKKLPFIPDEAGFKQMLSTEERIQILLDGMALVLKEECGQYMIAVQNILREQGQPKINEDLFTSASAAFTRVDKVLPKLRKTVQKEHDALLALLSQEKKVLNSRSLFYRSIEWISGPLSKVLFGVVLIGIRIAKIPYFNKITPNSKPDLFLEVIFLIYLVRQVSYRLFFKPWITAGHEKVYIEIHPPRDNGAS